jgi:hypothetical protein
MALFTTRVELIDGSPEDYQVLHDAMEAQGFKKTVTSNDGTRYRLPEAEYNFSGNTDKSSVLDDAKSAAESTGKSARILVTESAGRSWSNLKVIE